MLAAALVVFFWLKPQEEDPSLTPQTAAPRLDAEGLISTDDVNYDRTPTPSTIGEIALEVRERAYSLLTLDGSDAVSAAKQPGELTDLYQTRLRMLLQPSFDNWVAHVKSYSGSPTNVFSGEQLGENGRFTPETMAEWNKSARIFALSPLAIEQLSVRVHRLNGEDRAFKTGASVFRAMFNGRYVNNPDAENFEHQNIVEIVLPMRHQGDPSINAKSADVLVGLLFGWHMHEQRWRPYDIRVYSSRPMGIMRMPVF